MGHGRLEVDQTVQLDGVPPATGIRKSDLSTVVR
jgi:hypothetical protein